SAVTTRIVCDAALHGRTYHLAPECAVTAREIEEVLSAYFHYVGPQFAGREALDKGDLNALEKMFYTYVARYQPYWAEEPRFDCSNTRAAVPDLPCPPIDAACLRRLLDFAIRDNWGRSTGASPLGSRSDSANGGRPSQELLQ